MYTDYFNKDYLATEYPIEGGKTIRYVNLDNAATTPPLQGVIDKTMEFLCQYGSIHRGAGQKSRYASSEFEQAREIIQRFVKISDDNYVIFTKNTTEALNQAAALWSQEPGHVLVCQAEHSSNLIPWVLAEKAQGRAVLEYPLGDNFSVNPADVRAAFEKYRAEGKDIKLLTVTGASNILGYLNPIHELASIAHEYGAKILADCCQLVQHQAIDALPDDHPGHLDFIVFSGHKMYAPFGTGCLIGPRSFFDERMPYHMGGANLLYIDEQLEIARRFSVQAHDPGTPNAVGAVAAAKAADILMQIGMHNVHSHEHSLVSAAYDELAQLPEVVIYVDRDRLGSVLPFDIHGYHCSEVSQLLADRYGIGVRDGAFCMYHMLRKLKGLGIEDDVRCATEASCGNTESIPGIVRASFGLMNTQEDVERFVEAVRSIAKRDANPDRAAKVSRRTKVST